MTECCEPKNIIKEKEMFFCTNCGTIHGYSGIEYDFKFNEYNENIYNLLKCKNTIYKRKKYLNKNYSLDNRTMLLLSLPGTLWLNFYIIFVVHLLF